MRNALAAALLLVLACGGEQPAVKTTPGPTWTMQNRILDSPSLGFRLTAPAGYEWTKAEKQGDDVYTFTASGNNSEVRLTVYDRNYEYVTEAHVKELIDRVKPTYEAAGVSVRMGDIFPSDSPKMGPGYIYGYGVSSGKGEPAVIHGFVTARGRLYQLEKTSNSPWETYDLSTFQQLLTPVE